MVALELADDLKSVVIFFFSKSYGLQHLMHTSGVLLETIFKGTSEDSLEELTLAFY